MKESTAILNKINSFIEFTNAYCNGFMRDLNFELNEGELFSLLEKTKTNVDNALNDDFNTKLALNELLSLISYINKIYTKRKPSNSEIIHSNYGSLMACLNYIRFILDSVGLKLDPNNYNESTNVRN